MLQLKRKREIVCSYGVGGWVVGWACGLGVQWGGGGGWCRGGGGGRAAGGGVLLVVVVARGVGGWWL